MALKLNPALEVRPSPIDGLGIFSLVRFAMGDEFSVVVGDQPSAIMTNAEFAEYIEHQDSWDAIYLGNGMHQVSLVGRDDNPTNFGNHGCDPNTALSGDGRIALRTIEVGEELTIDYSSLSQPGWTMRCNCGAACCRGTVNGTQF